MVVDIEAALKGCTASVTVTKTAYVCGDHVEGHVTLDLAQAVDCHRLAIEVVGDEFLRWEAVENGVTDKEQLEKRFYTQEFIPLASPPPSTLAPGKHTYSFSIPLQGKLPGTLETAGGNALGWNNIISSIEYAVEVCVRPKGQSKTKVLTRLPIAVRSAPLPPATHPGSATTDSSSVYVRALCCIYKGKCELSLSTDCDATDAGGGQLSFRASVQNATSVAIRGLTLALEQSITMYIPDKFSHAGCRAGWTHTLLEQNFTHEIAPASNKDDIMINFTMAEVRAHNTSSKTHENKPQMFAVIPSSSLLFVSIRYRVTAKIIFASAAVNTVEVDLPVTLLNAPGHTPGLGKGGRLLLPTKPGTTTTAIQLVTKVATQDPSKSETSAAEPVRAAQVEIHQAP